MTNQYRTCCYCLTCTVAMEADAVYLDTLLLPAVQGLDLSGISDLNNVDQIVGRAGPMFPGGWEEVVLLTPVEECASGCMRSQANFVVPYTVGGNTYAVGPGVCAEREQPAGAQRQGLSPAGSGRTAALLHRTATTNAQGRALFFTLASAPGTYRLYVT